MQVTQERAVSSSEAEAALAKLQQAHEAEAAVLEQTQSDLETTRTAAAERAKALADAEQQCTELKTAVESSKSEIDTLQITVSSKDERIAELEAQLQEAGATSSAAQTRAAETAEQHTAALSELKEQHEKALAAQVSDHEAATSAHKGEIEQLQSEIQRLSAELQDEKDAKSKLEEQCAELNKTMLSSEQLLKADVDRFRDVSVEATKKMEGLEEQVSKLKERAKGAEARAAQVALIAAEHDEKVTQARLELRQTSQQLQKAQADASAGRKAVETLREQLEAAKQETISAQQVLFDQSGHIYLLSTPGL